MSFMEVSSAAILVPITRLSVCLKLYRVYVQYCDIQIQYQTFKCSVFDK